MTSPGGNGAEFGVKQVADQLHEHLRRYLEAQYHIRDTDIIEERRALLEEPGVIGQRPYLETTPTYEAGAPYAQLGLPTPIGETLTEIATWHPTIGVFPRPYMHQAEALREFLINGKDIVVATGTGSGKTETFLLPILGQLIQEAATRPSSFTLPGCRALLLYPMNALVSDQLSRLRRLFGDERLADLFKSRYGTFPRFGMYTGRTPYPGLRSSAKDQRHLEPILQYYLGLAADPTKAHVVEQLKDRGRWPAKDLVAFYGAKGGRWTKRLHTQPDDRELLTRHEIQLSCPHILVTNYSMLEYMLLRPIERTIFQQTRDWLAQDVHNTLILVLDEAHMYRGAGGAEVALLIRRLQARLNIPRDRMRCILTSASLGSDPEVEDDVTQFAVGLTGHPLGRPKPFSLIRGQQELRPPARPGTRQEATSLASFDLSAFFQRVEHPSGAVLAVSRLARELAWPEIPVLSLTQSLDQENERKLRAYLYERLYGFGPLEQLIVTTTGSATALATLERELFPDSDADQAEQATGALLALSTYAQSGDRTLLPTRAHLLFRGLPSLYACVNPACDARRHKPGEPLLLGRLYTEPRTHCTCTSQARVYELYTHRDCGAAFLHVFGRGDQASFYWHEQGGDVEQVGKPLDETLLLVEPPHRDMVDQVQLVWLEMTTGRVEVDPPQDPQRYRQFWRPSEQDSKRQTKNNGDQPSSPFTTCPVCTKRSGQKIMDLSTKGEQPFANLVREQFVLQPFVKQPDQQFPNGGRKVLLFSDGRQKAARLARDLPREVEFDSFRQALVLATKRVADLGREVSLDERLYVAFVSVCHDFHLFFFDGAAQRQLIEDMKRFEDYYDADLKTALEEEWHASLPIRYQQALLRQLSDPYYSLYAACAAVVQPSRASLRQLTKHFVDLPDTMKGNGLVQVASAWIQALLERTAFDPNLAEDVRRSVDPYYRPWANNEAIGRVERILKMQADLSKSQVEHVRAHLYGVLTRSDERNAVCLVPSALALVLAIDDDWWQCRACGLTQRMLVLSCCASCGGTEFDARPPDDPYMRARKNYFREPLRGVLAGARPFHMTAEEHTAQLSQRDTGAVYATTEEYELRFQDILLDEHTPPVDVLSCTTTMEVGVDIGSLTAVGLRNVPPLRENYQQRAGRAGRRGSAVSTVITYAQGGPHDSYYYDHPSAVISGKARTPRVKVDNRRLARRHIHSFLIQTFFYEQLDAMAPDKQRAIAASGSQLMMALGTARDFFAGDEEFSLARFHTWMDARAMQDSSPVADTIAGWLPDEICTDMATTEQKRLAEKHAFAVEVALQFLQQLEAVSRRFMATNAHHAKSEAGNSGPSEADTHSGQHGEDDGDVTDISDPGLLLNVLFDEGLLPSYAFPTDLSTFYVFDRDKKNRVRIKERPQQGKDKALSEYAPGRLLVIDKQTYRVGGIHDEFADQAAPARGLLRTGVVPYVYCPVCTYVREQKLGNGVDLCPVCSTPLVCNEMLDPPGFSPEGGRALSERDREQEFSYATSAQFPVPTQPDQFIWHADAGIHMRYAYGEDRRLVIVNKGPKEMGFAVCDTCGASWPETSVPDNATKEHARPYQVEWQVLQRAGYTKYPCSGDLHRQLYLGHAFQSDLLLLRIVLRSPLGYQLGAPMPPWLQDALRSLAEGLSLASSLQLDIDPGEVSAGYRLLRPGPGDEYEGQALADIYLFDTASGGAGYAAEAGEHLRSVLIQVQRLLEVCPENCERSCTKCLRHYGNRYWHERLDRRLGSQLLLYARDGIAPPVQSVTDQAVALAPLQRYLELEGWRCRSSGSLHGSIAPLLVEGIGLDKTLPRKVAVGLFPALADTSGANFNHPLHDLDSYDDVAVVLLNDYVVERDLPTAYQQFLANAHLVP